MFTLNLSSSIPSIADHIYRLYGGFKLIHDPDVFIDWYVKIDSPSLLRQFIRPQIQFSFDGYQPFEALPKDQAGAMLEWGLNWCIANNSNQFLIIHSAVIEKNGTAIIMPGSPGSGKSTLCAALVSRGWRLLSDEMALLNVDDGLLYPVARPVSLKNQSINIIKEYSADAVFGLSTKDTAKGTVAHMQPPDSSVINVNTPVSPAKVVFPLYINGSRTKLEPLDKGKAFMKVAENCFNYNVLGRVGFNVLTRAIDSCDSYSFEYQYLDEAIQAFEQLSYD
ncbi:MAG: HprK-related kinase A [Methylomarinum sp.]|nr:HprK-related kinase A [Methylomarinum sp.]